MRRARRIPCELWVQGTRYTGIVKDISNGGVFVHTRASAPRGSAITLVFAPSQGRTEIRVAGRVVRSDRIRAHLAMQSAHGIAVEVIEPAALGRVLSDSRLSENESDGEKELTSR